MPVLHVRLLIICFLASAVVCTAVLTGESGGARSGPYVHAAGQPAPIAADAAPVAPEGRFCAACGNLVPESIAPTSLAGHQWKFCGGACIERVAADPAAYYEFSLDRR